LRDSVAVSGLWSTLVDSGWNHRTAATWVGCAERVSWRQ